MGSYRTHRRSRYGYKHRTGLTEVPGTDIIVTQNDRSFLGGNARQVRVRGAPSKQPLARTSVDEIMKIGGWKTESFARYFIGATSSGQVQGSKWKRGRSYAAVSKLSLWSEFKKYFAECGRKE